MAAILEAHQARWAAAEGIIAVMAIGPALVAVATLALIAVLAARRRRATMSLARSRGASGRQVLVPAIVEGLLIAVPGAVVAALIAIALIPSGLLSPTLVGVAAVVAIAVAVVASDGGLDRPLPRAGPAAATVPSDGSAPDGSCSRD